MKRQKLAFSLAEALITLLIVCLITIASIPVLTKKKRNLSQAVHGSFKCIAVYVDRQLSCSSSVCSYIPVWEYWQQKGSDDWVKSERNDGCLFYPDVKAQKFVVTAVGGGGGGGGSLATNLSKEFKNSESFSLDNSGEYNITLIGGGGGGGGHGSSSNCGGSSGGGAQGGYFHSGKIRLDTGSYYMQIGNGGGPSYDDAKWAENGTRTEIQGNGGTVMAYASGGHGGRGRNWVIRGGCYGGDTKTMDDDEGTRGSAAKCPSINDGSFKPGNPANGVNGGGGFKIGESTYGRGGGGGISDYGGNPHWGYPGTGGKGYAFIDGGAARKGFGGKAGQVSSIVYEQIKTKYLILKPGIGGDAGAPFVCSPSIENSIVLPGGNRVCYPHGTSGKTTIVEGSPKLIAPGGEGGLGLQDSSAPEQQPQAGKIGPLADNEIDSGKYQIEITAGTARIYSAKDDILYAGSGGSGGGTTAATTNSALYSDGAPGTGGAVIVEW